MGGRQTDWAAVESYIVRIYRRSRKRPRVLVGTVETAGEEGKRAFSNAEELWEILEHHVKRSSSAPPDSRDDSGKEV
jgi:hypothetical protein